MNNNKINELEQFWQLDINQSFACGNDGTQYMPQWTSSALHGALEQLKSESPTVKECFELAFGEIPEGATCHLAYYVPESGYEAIICDFGVFMYFGQTEDATEDEPKEWRAMDIDDNCVSHDISNRLASEFAGFFGEAFDRHFGGVR